MECTWDAMLVQKGAQLPPELLQIIQTGTNDEYLQGISRASLDARYTYLLFAHCENIFAHVCASLRRYGSLATAVATLGRVVPFAPYLEPFATQLLANEVYDTNLSASQEDDLMYLLGLLRLIRFNHRVFKEYVDLVKVRSFLGHSSRAVAYLAIRVLQICLDAADHWFEQMFVKYIGQDLPDNDISGQWDDKVIDYRFLSLWEEQRYEQMLGLLQNIRHQVAQSRDLDRVIPESCFHQSTTVVGNVLLPRNTYQHAASQQIENFVSTPTVAGNLSKIAEGLKSPQPLLLTGLGGSGKTTLARHIALRLGKLSKMVTLHLNEQADAKLLIGIYTTGDTPGSFVWKPGVLTTAVQEGRWILIEDLDRAPNEIISMLLPLIERRELFIPNHKQTIHASEGFKIIATVRNTINHRGEETRPLAHILGARYWHNVMIDMPSTSEQMAIVQTLYPGLAQLLPQFMSVYERLQASQKRAVLIGKSKVGVVRTISARDLLKWCCRVTKLLQQRLSFTSSDMDDIFMEAIDCFIGALPDGLARTEMAAIIAEGLHIDPQRRDYLLGERDVRFQIDKSKIVVGRYSLPRTPHRRSSTTQSSFSTNPHTSRMLERVAAAVINREPLLLVGETGVGKTTAVQHLASHLGKKLEPVNLSQQSEVGDLLGGFKPVTARSLMVPMKDEFDGLFRASFSISKNQRFLELLGKQTARNNWKAVCKLWLQALKMVEQQRTGSPSRHGEAPNKRRKVESREALDFARWDAFAGRVTDVERRLNRGSESFAFSFVESNIVKAVRNGDWVLLDEINLASPDTLESIADLLEPTSPSILLTEAGSIERIEAHPDFRLFAAMNPATDVGKKDLPPGVRSRFTELYVDSLDKDIRSLQSIVRSYLRTETATDAALAPDISLLYQTIISLAEQNKLVDGAGLKPHFSLRTLTRTLSFAKYIAPQCSIRRALYEGFQMSFLTFLNVQSAQSVQPLLEQHILGKRTNIHAELQKSLRKPSDGQNYIQGYPGSKHWVRLGDLQPEEQPHYILTPFIRSNLENLVRAASTRQFPVLIQGPTSSGKTSMVEYLAKRTGHKFVRINNHEHTDLQEYLGTYVSDSDGKLHFQEGVLVRALREGHWIVLDELNLAPTDVLEALNRLLDDNRELLIPETQEVIRPHENFMLFATQNPAGLYGGRKPLSRAFRNRFLELHFDDIPIEELQEILHRRTQLPESRCRRIVTVYRELSVLRQENRLFERKSFATLRDLFRWALRPNDTIEQLATNGFMLLAERVRKPEERQALKDVIQKVMSAKGPRVVIDEDALYSAKCPEIQSFMKNAKSQGVVWTRAMRRLFVLVSRAIQNSEPVLLVGETGCGKTTVCQMLADALDKTLNTVNAHQNTETGDLIGSQRPVRNRATIETNLRDMLMISPLLQDIESDVGYSTDALLDAYDRELSYVEPIEQQLYCNSQAHKRVNASRTRFKALFEWSDGSLVQAMKDGSYFLLDEISLADDSVLERINSVLETSRSILLAEKGSLDSFVRASPDFQFFATMNPGGDYGKRELSPALRNRFTEIWVPALSNSDDIVDIVSAKLVSGARQYATAIVDFAQWFRDRYNTSAASSISVRDALSWVQFVNTFAHIDLAAAIVHGAAMVYIDTLGANPAGLMTLTGRTLDDERSSCLVELGRLISADANAIYSAPVEVEKSVDSLSIGPFSIPSRRDAAHLPETFTFDAQTTRKNAMRVVRAMQLSRPVMLEGSPGVGKTVLVTAIAKAVGMPLTRINLSEQTDLLDLFGSDAPVDGAATGTFEWHDAPFLRAMKGGEWVLLDEMNLASQSVLEGLNACLDHRGEIFVPELNQTFKRNAGFRLFAAQNPHHQGGGRKGLPASFVNRFTVVYADNFRPDDLMVICRRIYPQIDKHILEQAVQFVEKLNVEVVQRRHFGANGAPWEFNLRDISRWLDLLSSGKGLLKAGQTRDFIDFLFTQRFRSANDRALVEQISDSIFQDAAPRSDIFSTVSCLNVQLGLAVVQRHSTDMNALDVIGPLSQSNEHLRVLESVLLCVQQRWPVILTGPSGAGKSTLLQRLATIVGASLMTIAIGAETDATDLIGGYEQLDPLRWGLQAIENLRVHLLQRMKSGTLGNTSDILEALALLHNRSKQTFPGAATLLRLRTIFERLEQPELMTLLDNIQECTVAIDKARFEWINGLLVEALVQGKWLVLDNANLCSASVLDRLNSLLEPHGALIINEHTGPAGSPCVIRPHPEFRIFLTVDPRFGELSRPMRNRAVELHLPDNETESLSLDPLEIESSMARFRQVKALGKIREQNQLTEQSWPIALDHLGLRDQPLLSRLERQMEAGLYQAVNGASVAELQLLGIDDSTAVARRDHLLGFYQAAISQVQTPADFACAQTFHPLNNQALVQQNQHIFSQASTLAFVHSVRAALVPLLKCVVSLKSSPVIIRQLGLVGRPLSTKKASKGATSEVLGTIERILHLTLEWAQELSGLPIEQLQMLKATLRQFCSLLWYFIQLCGSNRLDQATFIAWRSSVQTVLCTERDKSTTSLLGRLIHNIGLEIQSFGPQHQGLTGRACAPMWKALRPARPSTISHLNSLLEFEELVDRFDGTLALLKQSPTDTANTCLSFVRALKAATTGNADVHGLSEKLQNLMPEGHSSALPDDTPWKPHFSSVFELLSQDFAIAHLHASPLSPEDLATIELLAGRRTKRSITLVIPCDTKLPQDDFHLLSCALPSNSLFDAEHPSQTDWAINLLDCAKSVDNIRLSSLQLLESEVEFFGRLVSRQAHVLSWDKLAGLNPCLDRLLNTVLSSLASASDDPELNALGSTLLDELNSEHEDGNNNDSRLIYPSTSDPSGVASDLVWIHEQMQDVVRYVRSIRRGKVPEMERTVITWGSFACACLALYTPAQPYDPALKPHIQKIVHKHAVQDLSRQLQFLRSYRQAMVGESQGLRARMVEADIEGLGQEPEIERVCRPEISEIAQLQIDFDGMMRAIRPVFQSFHTDGFQIRNDPVLWKNLGRIRERLLQQHRAYGDLTGPVIGFIDCLRMSQNIQTVFMLDSSAPRSASVISGLVPFVMASFDEWLHEGNFTSAFSSRRSQEETIFLLSVFAARCSVWPVSSASTTLRGCVTLQFTWLYEQWKTKLSEDQKRAAAKSSLYRYKGNEDLADEEEALSDLFPTYENVQANSVGGAASKPEIQSIAPQLASLYHGIFAQPKRGARPFWELLEQYAQLERLHLGLDGRELLPTVIVTTRQLIAGFTNSNTKMSRYNIYNDPNIELAKRLSTKLSKIKDRFADLHEAWPDHATPVEVLRLVAQILDIGHSQPLMKFLPSMEKLYAAMSQWQQVSSRIYSVNDLLEDLTDLIVSWRQLELSSWAGLLDRESTNAEIDASSWWFIAFETIIVASHGLRESPDQLRHHANNLITTLQGFILNCGLGEYGPRLAMLRDFEAHLAASALDVPSISIVHQALANFIAYYTNFEPAIEGKMATGRASLEKEIKNITQVASWKARNIEMLRQSAQTSHRRLLRVLRKFRNLLAQPVEEILLGSIPHRQFQQGTNELNRASKHGFTTHTADHGPKQGVPTAPWVSRPDRFINIPVTVSLMRSIAEQALKYVDGPGRLSSFVTECTSSIAELQKATPAVLTEENRQQVKHLKGQKRRLLADVLRDVRAMGFQTNISADTLAQQVSLTVILASSPALLHFSEIPGIEKAEYHFYRLLSIMPAVRENARKHSDDLTPAESTRCLTLLESMLQTSISQRAKICRHLQSTKLLGLASQQLAGFSQCVKPIADPPGHDSSLLETRAACLGMTLDNCLQLIQAQSSLSGCSYSALIDGLVQRKRTLAQLQHDIAECPPLPVGLQSASVSSLHACLHETEDDIQALIRSASKEHLEVEPILSHLLAWITSNSTNNDLDDANHDCVMTANEWVDGLLHALDKSLEAVQGLRVSASVKSTTSKEWLLQQSRSLGYQLDVLRLEPVSASLMSLLRQLQYVHPGTDISILASISRDIQPIVATFTMTAYNLLERLCALQEEINKTAYQLAGIFIQLAQKGFCSPPEKSEDKTEKAGDVEAGTGLGEGEGAEDISKDIEDDEDLSELAQEHRAEDDKKEIEDNKDAVDMADEEMEGELLEQPDNGSEEDANGNDEEEQDADMDEQPGEVDDSGLGALDEKMWDDGQIESQAEKETGDGKGSSQNQDLAAANEEREADQDQKGEEHDSEELQAADDEKENIEHPETDDVHPHAQDEQALELPDDIAMDGQKADEAGDSDFDELSDAMDEQTDKLDDNTEDNSGAVDSDETPQKDEVEQDESVEAKLDEGKDAGDEEQSGEDESRSDILMQDNKDENSAKSADDTAFGETGTGADQSETQAPQAQAAATTEAQDVPNGTEPEQESNGGASGVQREKRTQETETAAENPSDDAKSLPYQKVGDALNEWYRQHRQIESARERESEAGRLEDVEMANVQFEHLPNDEIAADTQALGTASAEQSTGIDEEKGLPVNDEPDLAPNDTADEQSMDDDHPRDDGARLEPSDILPPVEMSKAFIGEPRGSDADAEMADEAAAPDEDRMEHVDDQLLNTHLDNDNTAQAMSIEEARGLWSEYESRTQNFALVLTEHLRLILQPTQATKMRGDFRTGKRLNIKRIIPYIASSYKRDKIWMRRSVPTKRSYQIMLAIDDSKSMAESESRGLAFETLALVSKAMSTLEVGELSIVGFGEDVTIAHEFSTPFTSEAGAAVFRNFTFAQSKTNVRKLLAESIELFRSARLKAAGSASDLWQLQLIISDGVCEDHPTLRQLVRQAHEERIMIVFIVVDAAAQHAQTQRGSRQSILDLQTAEFIKDQNNEMQLKMVKYLDTFPFNYYLIVRDVQELPSVLAGALRQWFAEVVEIGG